MLSVGFLKERSSGVYWAFLFKRSSLQFWKPNHTESEL